MTLVADDVQASFGTQHAQGERQTGANVI
jgi:hypothetical protein